MSPLSSKSVVYLTAPNVGTNCFGQLSTQGHRENTYTQTLIYIWLNVVNNTYHDDTFHLSQLVKS